MINFQRLRDIREDNDLSQEKMASILGVKRARYSLWELGINIIPLKYLFKFADYFHCNIDYILGLTNDKNVLSEPGYDRKTIGKRIKALRIKNNLSQEYLANTINVTQACIAKYEKGSTEISITNLYELSKEFNVSMSYLCDKEEKQAKITNS